MRNTQLSDGGVRSTLHRLKSCTQHQKLQLHHSFDNVSYRMHLIACDSSGLVQLIRGKALCSTRLNTDRSISFSNFAKETDLLRVNV